MTSATAGYLGGLIAMALVAYLASTASSSARRQGTRRILAYDGRIRLLGWVLAARPRIALIGVGLGNDYGHPFAGTVNAYRAVGALVGRTDLDGDLAVVLDDDHHLGLVRRGTG